MTNVPSSSNPGVSNPAGGPTAGDWPPTEETLPTGDEVAEGKGPKTEENPTGEPEGGVGPDANKAATGVEVKEKAHTDDEDEEETTP